MKAWENYDRHDQLPESGGVPDFALEFRREFSQSLK
jgi:hypothetical protein